MSDIPFGTIVMFSGIEVPTGWLLCNGQNETPDLTNKFIFGGQISDVGGNGGGNVSGDKNSRTYTRSTSQAPVDMTARADDHALTISELPVHNHAQGDMYDGDYNFLYGSRVENKKGTWINGGSFSDQRDTRTGPYTNSVGGNKPHSHNVTVKNTAHDHTINVIPPYYILAFIIYIG